MGFVRSRRFAVSVAWALGYIAAYIAATFDLSSASAAAIGVVGGVALAALSVESKEA